MGNYRSVPVTYCLGKLEKLVNNRLTILVSRAVQPTMYMIYVYAENTIRLVNLENTVKTCFRDRKHLLNALNTTWRHNTLQRLFIQGEISWNLQKFITCFHSERSLWVRFGEIISIVRMLEKACPSAERDAVYYRYKQHL